MNHKRSDCSMNFKDGKSKDAKKDQNKQDTALVSVGMKKSMKSGY